MKVLWTGRRRRSIPAAYSTYFSVNGGYLSAATNDEVRQKDKNVRSLRQSAASPQVRRGEPLPQKQAKLHYIVLILMYRNESLIDARNT
jgi:hypothetical protein